MFQLLQPIWLFALAGLSIPVIIHLWNQRPGKTLRVGSVSLVTENTVSHKKSIKLTEILLLILRCLLLSCIAIALAAPFWKSPVNNQSKGWVLMNKKGLAETYNHFKPVVDSLLQAGMEFHYFEEGFSKENLEKAVAATADTASEHASYRSKIALLNEQADAKLPLYIFTDNYLRNFSGSRSSVSLNLHWFVYTPGTSNTKQVDDTAAIRVTIFSGQHSNDARYLKAAADAIQQFSKKNIIVKNFAKVTDVPAQQDWLFWLGEETIPADKKAGNVLQYAKGNVSASSSYIVPAGKYSFDPIQLYAEVVEQDADIASADVYWKDAFGHPLLSAEEKNGTKYYWLYTHIDPAWNELPWNSSFPQLLYQLLYQQYEKPVFANANDNTIIDTAQLMPVLLNGKDAGFKPILFKEIKLDSLFWLIAFILFFAERVLSFYHRKTITNG